MPISDFLSNFEDYQICCVSEGFKSPSWEAVKIIHQGTKFERMLDARQVGISYYILYHNNGLSFYYSNNSENIRLTETIVFSLRNCKIWKNSEYTDLDSCAIDLRPGMDYLIEIKRESEDESFEAEVSSVMYELTEM